MYYSRMANKLTSLKKSSKVYWSLLNIFLNNKKTTLIPPIFQKNEFASDIKKKAHIFDSFFAKQCILINTNSNIPSNPYYTTVQQLPTVNFIEDILKIIPPLDSNTAHGHDNLSICMLKMCGKPFCKPLSLISNQCISSSNHMFGKAIWDKLPGCMINN